MIKRFGLFFIVAGLLMGCGLQPETEQAVTVTVLPPTPTLASVISDSGDAATPEPSPTATEIVPTDVPPTVVPPTATPTSDTSSGLIGDGDDNGDDDTPAGTHRVLYVTEDDVLNVRSGPSVDTEIVGTIPAGAEGIIIESYSRRQGTEQWVSISYGELTGWVNSSFLTERVASDSFCDASVPEILVEDFRQAITNEDDTALGALLNGDRGLRVHRNWWNPVVVYSGSDVDSLLANTTIQNWGFEDGTGSPINGTFSEIAMPLFQRDLLPATEIGCNEILAGGTAGVFRLPDGYEGSNFYSVYRPYTENEFDWGTWVIGIEQWQGEYYISYLIHYQWEI